MTTEIKGRCSPILNWATSGQSHEQPGAQISGSRQMESDFALDHILEKQTMTQINNDHAGIYFSEAFDQKEKLQQKFFKECIKKTNQFSAQFVLDKMFQEHLRHLNELKEEVGILKAEKISRELCHSYQSEVYFVNLCKDYDLSTLTLSEAARLAIHIEERDLDFFRGVLNIPLSDNSKKALKRIINHKTNFIEYLKRENERILVRD
jgi:hypothetical protein